MVIQKNHEKRKKKMGNYNFNSDLEISKESVKDVSNILKDRGVEILNFYDSMEYDIKVRYKGNEKTIEVKEDFYCQGSGNVAVEYECRGKPSGIATSTSDLFVYEIHEPDGIIGFYIISRKDLTKAISEKKFFASVSGGDAGSNTKMFLFKLPIFKSLSMKLK